jgi:hypothetical protein
MEDKGKVPRNLILSQANKGGVLNKGIYRHRRRRRLQLSLKLRAGIRNKQALRHRTDPNRDSTNFRNYA